MTLQEVIKELEQRGDANTKKVLMSHGAREPLVGVKVADLKIILKKTKKDHALSLELYKTGNSDAMYLAGLMTDEKQVTREQLEEWVGAAYWSYLSEYIVPWVAAESAFGFEFGMKWIASAKETVASAGWGTLTWLTSLRPPEELDVDTYSKLLTTVQSAMATAQPRVKYTMNGFLIAVGANLPPLRDQALKVADTVGKVNIDMGGTACKVPDARTYILKTIAEGRAGKIRKSFRS